MGGLRNNTDPENDILYVNWNQNATCLSVGTRSGYRIYNADPFGKCFHDAEGGIGIVEMLFNTSLVALVGAGEQPAFSPRRLRLWNTKTKESICELNFVTAILSVNMNNQRLVVGLERKIYIFDLHSMQTLETLDISPNPKALCILSQCEKGYMAFPSGSTSAGEVLIYDTMNLNVLSAIQVHKADVSALAFNSDSTLLASASDTGTIIRVFVVPNGKKKAVFRRGSRPATIYCLAFNQDSTILCASSDSGTIHLFSMTGTASSATGSFASLVPPSSLEFKSITGGTTSTSNSSTVDSVAENISQYLPESISTMVEGTRDFAYARLRVGGVPNLCAIHGPTENSSTVQVSVATMDGYFYQYSIDTSVGGECRLERENVLRDTASEEIQAAFLKTTT